MSKLTRFFTSLLARYCRWAASSVSPDEPNAPVIEMLSRIVPVTIGLWLSALATLVILGVANYANVRIALGANLGLVGLLVLGRRGYARLSHILGLFLFWATITFFVYQHGSVYSVHLFGYVIVTMVAAWVGGMVTGVATWLLSVVTVSVLAQAEAAGLLPPVTDVSPVNLMLNLAGYLAFSVVVLSMARANATMLLNLARAEIAQRERAEAALRELNATLERRVAERINDLLASEERYRLLLALSPDGISVVDNMGQILACNEQLAHLYGFDRSSEMIGRHAAEFTTPDAFAGLFAKAAEILKAGQDVAREIEAEFFRRDGSIIALEYSIARVPWAEAPSGEAFLANVRDVTSRKTLLAELTRHRTHLEELVQQRTHELQAEIAERAAAQAALQRSQSILAEAERIAHVGSWERDLSTGEIHSTDELLRIFHLDASTAPTLRTLLFQAIHPADREAAEAAAARLSATGEKFNMTYRINLPDGEIRVLHAEAEALLDEVGSPTHVRGMVQDITEREQAQAALAKRIQELSILEELGHPISFAHSLAEIIQIYVERVRALAGLDLAQVYLLREGRLHPAGVATDLAGEAGVRVLDVGECLCGLAVQDGRSVYSPEIEGDPRCTLSEGHVRGLHSLIALPLQSSESFIGVLALGAVAPGAFDDRLSFLETIGGLVAGRLQNAMFHQEIQDRAAGLEETVAERTRELQTERDRTQAILETVGESVIVTDLEGRVLYANPATMTLTGASRDEVLGQPLWRNWSAHMLKEIWPYAREALAHGRPWGGEVTGRRRDGSSYSVVLTATPLFDESVASLASGAVWVQRDITSVKEAERLKDQFVSNVSHELRTPISIIGLGCDNLTTFRDRLSEEDRGQLLQDIHEQAHVLGSLIEDILTLSRIDSGRVPRAWQAVDLARLVREQAERQRVFADSRGQELTVAAEVPVVIQGGPVQLQQVVRNLLDNAIKYSPVGGRIRCFCEVSSGGLTTRRER